MAYTYKTIAANTEGQYKEKGSRFLAFGFPVKTDIEIKNILENLRKVHHSAKHVCYAYRLGYENYISRMNDDGEPSGTAGKPIFNQIVAHDLTYILIAVVRYFGGQLLGTAGLMNAYREATIQMLSAARIIVKTAGISFHIAFPYEQYNQIIKLLKEESALITDQKYDETCSVTVTVGKNNFEKLNNRLLLTNGLKISNIHEEIL